MFFFPSSSSNVLLKSVWEQVLWSTLQVHPLSQKHVCTLVFYAGQAKCFSTSLKRWGQPVCALVCGHNVQWAVMAGWAPCRASASRANVGVMKHPASAVITCCGPTSQKNMHQLQDVWAPELQNQHKYDKSAPAFLDSVYRGVWNVMVSWRICGPEKL